MDLPPRKSMLLLAQDIFFPTDFDMLQRLHAAAAAPGTATAGETLKSSKFFGRSADLRRTALQGSNEYNPLRDDFSNTSIFTGSSAAA